MKTEAWKTLNRNQNRLAMRKAAALGSRKVKNGRTYIEGRSAASVTYCSACKGPVVDDAVGRKRHAAKGPDCKAAMEQQKGPAA